jgi:hypothetical protein
MRELAHDVIAAGFPVIVDAAFLRYAERESFRALAKEMTVPFVIAGLQTDTTQLAKRLVQRSRHGNDASEADVPVMRKLQQIQQPLREEELKTVVTFINNRDVDALFDIEGWESLEAHLAKN